MTQEWIPIIEKQPEKSGQYFVTAETTVYDRIYHQNIVIRRTVTADYLKRDYGGSFWDVHQRDEISRYVTAWMPLPEPYDDKVTKEL